MRDIGLTRSFATQGVELFANEIMTDIRHLSASAVAYGKLFDRDVVTADAVPESASSGIDFLNRTTWGAYVAISTNGPTEIGIVRDPSGFIPCYYTPIPGGVALSSSATLLVQSGCLTPKIDWDILADELSFPAHFGAATPIVGIQELIPGTELRVNASGHSVRTLWSPWAFCTQRAKLEQTAAVEALRETLAGCHSAWATAFPSSLVTVSGGLDSSIVATSIAHSGRPPVLLNFYTEDGMGDERAAAKLIADKCGTKLMVLPYEAPSFEQYVSHPAHLPRPASRGIANGIVSALAKQLRDRGCQAIFNGYGGDNVFCSMRSGTPLIDRALSGGSIRELTETAISLARLTGVSIPTVLASAVQAFGTAFFVGTHYRWLKSGDFLNAHIASQATPRNPHPWLAVPHDCLPGKAAHIASLIRAQYHLDRFPREAGVANISTLLSTPVVEACLSIPSWLWCTKGRDRAVARDAADGQVPSSLLSRSFKGSPVDLHTRFFYANRIEIEELLVEGQLAKHGLLDKHAVAAYVRRSGPPKDMGYLRLLELADAEIWCRSWTLRASGSRPVDNVD